MSRELTSHRIFRTPSRQRGVGLPVAIFVITVLAAFVVNMGYLVQDNATGRIEYVQSLRALLAAESGGDLGLNVLFDPFGCHHLLKPVMFQHARELQFHQ